MCRLKSVQLGRALAALLMIAVFAPLPAAGKEGSSRALPETSAHRSVRLNSYNNYAFRNDSGWDEMQMLSVLARRDNVLVTEKWPPYVPFVLKKLNPKVKVYRYYTLCGKHTVDWDITQNSLTGMMLPLTRSQIDANDWWLRDGLGRLVKEGDSGWFTDVGKPGFKEAYLESLLRRMTGSGLDGVIFDYWWPEMISQWVTKRGLPAPARYPNDRVWFEKAWKPFIEYVTTGLHDAGYRIIGNEAGAYDTGSIEKAWQREKVDGVVYEQWAIDWPARGSNWLSGEKIEKRIRAFNLDPKEAWTGEYGLVKGLPDYSQKQVVSLAMYYIALPDGQKKRSYGQQGNGKVYWDSIWDTDIGVPSESATKMSGKFFWSREYTRGLILLNYEADNSIDYKLRDKYRDTDGREFTGSVALKPHTALILRDVE